MCACLQTLLLPLLLLLQGDKDGKDWGSYERPFMLSVEDPKDPSNDICK